MKNTESLPFEEAAEQVANVAGWVCKTCRRFYGEDERVARYCCARDLKCSTEGCTGRAEKPYTFCGNCREKKELARWLAYPEVPWDGETPLCLDDDDEFFYSQDDLEEYLAQNDLKPEDLRLVICKEDTKPYFDMMEFLTDYLPEDMEPDDPAKIDALVNRWIEKHVPTVWVPGKMRPTLESLRVPWRVRS